MVRSLRGMIGFRIVATDGEVGKVEDFFLDDESWTVRYLIDRSGGWIKGRELLISPAEFDGSPDHEKKIFPLSVSSEKVRKSPDIETRKPVSRQKEYELLRYYGAPIYWQYYASQTLPPIPATPPVPEDVFEEMSRRDSRKDKDRAVREDTHLRSFNEINGYTVTALDGRAGGMRDILIDEGSWEVRLFVVDINSWIPGGNVLVEREFVDGVSWESREISVNLDSGRIIKAPRWKGPGAGEDYERSAREYYREH